MTYRVLVLGDTHIPSRRDSIPKEFYQYIKDTIYDLALITGDLERESDMRDALPPLPRSFIVVGNMDYGSSYNFHEQVQLDDFNLLLIHGTQLRPRGNIEQLWMLQFMVIPMKPLLICTKIDYFSIRVLYPAQLEDGVVALMLVS